MKIFTEKGILNKLILIVLAIIILNAIIPTNVSYAAKDEGSVGGVLLKPISNLMLALGDFVMDLIHNVVYDMPTSIIRVDNTNDLWQAILIVLAVVVAILVLVAIGGGALAGAASIIGKIATAIGTPIAGTIGSSIISKVAAAAIGTILVTSVRGGVAAGIFTAVEQYGDQIPFPIFRVTPEEIFKGEIALLDINFFKTADEIKEEFKDSIDTTGTLQNRTSVFSNTYYKIENNSETVENTINDKLVEKGYTGERIELTLSERTISRRWGDADIAYEATIKIERYTEAIAGEVKTGYNCTFNIESGEWIGAETQTLGLQLKETIAKWYYAIRNFALIAMMIILIYIGIRILMSGLSSEKAKYKNMLMDWVVAVCLIFIMHYIMAFSMNIVESVGVVFGAVKDEEAAYTQGKKYAALYEYDPGVARALEDAGVNVDELRETDPETGIEVIRWDAKNIVGIARVEAALNNSGSYLYMGYVMCYLVLVFFTVFFLFTYLKRALYLTFFTIIAPLVAMTYPIDKLHDGKAQAFDMWLKEYIFNLMIQPVHLLLYTILISSAFELASTNILYTITAIGFIMPAEKFLRKMFGFDKAQTPGFLSGPAGAALMITGFNKLFNRKPSKGIGGSGDGTGNGSNKLKSSDENPMGSDITEFSALGKEADNNQGENSNIFEDVSRMKAVEESNTSLSQTGLNNLDIERRLRGNAANPILNKGNPKPIISDRIKRKLQEEREQSLENFKEKHEKLYKGLESADKVRNAIGSRAEKIGNGIGKGWRFASGYAKSYAGQRLQRSFNNVVSGKPIRDVANFVGGAYAGAGAFVLGSTIALSSDKPIENIPKYGGTLSAAAYAMGSRDSRPNYDVNTAFEDARRAQFDSEEEYQKMLMEEERNKTIEDENNLKELRKYLRLKEISEEIEKLYNYGDCIDSGIKDMKDLATIIQLTESGKMDRKTAATAAKYYKKAGGKPKNMGERDLKDLKFQYRNKVKGELKQGSTESDKDYENRVDNTVKIILGNIDLFGTTKDNLTEI